MLILEQLNKSLPPNLISMLLEPHPSCFLFLLIQIHLPCTFPSSLLPLIWWWCRNGHELRIVHRKALLEALVEELPMETVRYSSKHKSIVNQVEEGSSYAIIHMENGVSIKAKVNRNYIWSEQYYIAKTFFTKLVRSD